MKYLLVTDLDNTLVGKPDATVRLNRYLQAYRHKFILVYATGRSYPSARQLIHEAQLLEPDYWITSVGTEIYQRNTLDSYWSNRLAQDWNREAVWAIARQFPALKPQSECNQNSLKASFCLDSNDNSLIIQQLVEQLQKSALTAQVIFSSSRDVDILPIDANKGNATSYLRNHLQVPPQLTLVCGDSGNDRSLFQQPSWGVIVSNAQPELIHWYHERRSPWHYLARSSYADGILEALFHFNFIDSKIDTSLSQSKNNIAAITE